MTKLAGKLQDFLNGGATGGIALMFAAALALVFANTSLNPYYSDFLATPVVVAIGSFEIAKPLLLWINDGLMAIFFFLVGLEIKREVLAGELSSFDKAALPLAAAVGGMAGPAAIYWYVNMGSPETLQGWAIPAATDIAFALGILMLLGPRVPVTLKILLLAIAIIDDLGAILIIAMFYTENLSLASLAFGGAGFAALVALNRMGVKSAAPYVLVGIVMWACVLKSGVHATLAGVLTALAIPLHGATKEAPSPLHKLEHGLHPWVAFLVLPLFAFANAGVSLQGVSLAAVLAPAPLGIAAGLFLGKQIGVMGASFAMVKLGLARLPDGANWMMVYGVACLTGVGFTMSLFIGGLAFSDPALMDQVRLGVLTGSICSAIVGFLVLKAAIANAPAQTLETRRTAHG